MIKRNRKLWEAIGLFLILSAWILEWRSVRKWEEAEKVTQEFYKSLFNVIGGVDDHFARQFQFALSRAVQNITLDPNDISHAYRVAWKNAEVRKIWFDQSMFNLRGVKELTKNISKVSSRYGLGLPKTQEGIESRYSNLIEELNKSINPEKRISNRTSIPNDVVVTPERAVQLRGKINELISDSINPLNELLKTIRMKIRSNSRLHGALFMIGSIFLISAKIIEWRIEKSTASTQVDVGSSPVSR